MTVSSGTDIGVINQAQEAFNEVLVPLLTFADNISDLSRLAAVALELGRLQQHQKQQGAIEGSGIDDKQVLHKQQMSPEVNGRQKQSQQQSEESASIIKMGPANTAGGESWSCA